MATHVAPVAGYNSLKFELGVRNQQALIANFHAKEREIVDAMRRASEAAAYRAQGIAYMLCPVDTSPTADDFAMRDHIKIIFSPDKLAWELGWYAEDFFDAGLPFYAFFVEFGTRYMPARPSLRPAADMVESELLADLQRAVQGVI